MDSKPNTLPTSQDDEPQKNPYPEPKKNPSSEPKKNSKKSERPCAYLRFNIGSRFLVIELTKDEVSKLGTSALHLDKSTAMLIRQGAARHIMTTDSLNENTAFNIYPTNDTSDDAAAFGFSAQEFLLYIDGTDVSQYTRKHLNKMCESLGI
jgi:hypothetical protein